MQKVIPLSEWEREILDKISQRNNIKISDKLYSEYLLKDKTVICIIMDDAGNIHLGQTKCSPKDKFISEIGTRIAFTRAFKEYLSWNDFIKTFDRIINNNYEG